MAIATGEGVTAWDTASSEPYILPQSVFVGATSIAYCDRGRLLIAGFGDPLNVDLPGALLIINERRATRGFQQLSNAVLAIATDPVSKLVLYAGGDRRVTCWNLTCPDRSVTAAHSREIRAIAMSPDGKQFGATDDYSVRVYHTESLQLVRRLSGHKGRVDSLAYTPDGRFIVTGSWDKTVRFWDVETGQQAAAHDWDLGNVRAVAVSPDGLLAAATGDRGKIVIWDLNL